MSSLSRCPYCHEDTGDEFVACRQCLAKHHAGCWLEHGACASCGEARFLGDIARGSRATPKSLEEAIQQLLAGPTAEQIAARSPRERRGMALAHLVFAALPLFLVVPLLLEDLTNAQTVALAALVVGLPPVLLALVWRDMKRWLDASRQTPRTRAVVAAPEVEKDVEAHRAGRARVE